MSQVPSVQVQEDSPASDDHNTAETHNSAICLMTGLLVVCMGLVAIFYGQAWAAFHFTVLIAGAFLSSYPSLGWLCWAAFILLSPLVNYFFRARLRTPFRSPNIDMPVFVLPPLFWTWYLQCTLFLVVGLSGVAVEVGSKKIYWCMAAFNITMAFLPFPIMITWCRRCRGSWRSACEQTLPSSMI